MRMYFKLNILGGNNTIEVVNKYRWQARDNTATNFGLKHAAAAVRLWEWLMQGVKSDLLRWAIRYRRVS